MDEDKLEQTVSEALRGMIARAVREYRHTGDCEAVMLSLYNLSQLGLVDDEIEAVMARRKSQVDGA